MNYISTLKKSAKPDRFADPFGFNTLSAMFFYSTFLFLVLKKLTHVKTNIFNLIISFTYHE